MTEQESRSESTNLIKQKIRERYKGISEEILDVIPAKEQEDFYSSDMHKRVAAEYKIYL